MIPTSCPTVDERQPGGCLSPGRIRGGAAFYCSLFFIFLLSLSSYYPPLRALPFLNLLWAVLIFAWLSAALIVSRKFFFQVTKYRLLSYAFVLYSVGVPFIAGVTFISLRYLELSQLLIFYWAFELCERLGRVREAKWLLMLHVPFVVATCILNLFGGADSANIARLAKKDTLKGIANMEAGYGGYEFIYMLVFVVSVLLYFCLDYKLAFNWLQKLAIFSFIILLVVTIFASNFTSAALLVILAIAWRLQEYMGFRGAIVMLGAVVCCGVIFYMPEINVYMDVASGTSVNLLRFQELLTFADIGVMGGAMSARLSAYLLSISVFIDNPVFGLMLVGIERTTEGITAFGQHSYILDAFALFGGVFGLCQIYISMWPIKCEYNKNIYHSRSVGHLMFAAALGFLVINNLTPSIAFALYFVFPVLNHYLGELGRGISR